MHEGNLTDGQEFALFLAAHVDDQLTLIERATAALTMERFEVRKQPVPGLLVGQWLTDSGREAVRAMLPEPTPDVWPYVVADVMRRVRARSRGLLLCADVRALPIDVDGRQGWRVSWESDGWTAFSRQSDDPDAARNRAELEGAATSLGLEVIPEAAPTMLVAVPVDEILIPYEAVEAVAKKEAAARMTTLDKLILVFDQEERDQKDRMLQWRAQRQSFLRAHHAMRVEDLDDTAFAAYCATIEVAD